MEIGNPLSICFVSQMTVFPVKQREGATCPFTFGARAVFAFIRPPLGQHSSPIQTDKVAAFFTQCCCLCEHGLSETVALWIFKSFIKRISLSFVSKGLVETSIF